MDKTTWIHCQDYGRPCVQGVQASRTETPSIILPTLLVHFSLNIYAYALVYILIIDSDTLVCTHAPSQAPRSLPLRLHSPPYHQQRYPQVGVDDWELCDSMLK